MKSTLTGILPPLAMPFDDKGDIVFSAIAEQIDLMIDRKVNAVVVGGSTGEGHTLDREEFAAVMHAADRAIAGRVPLIAGLIVNSTREALARIRLLDRIKLAALQITPVHYLFKPDADATVAHFRTLAAATDVPILIYNVIPWNYLDVALMQRIMDEVPGVVGMKQSAGDLKSVSDLVAGLAPGRVVLTGTDALLYPAFALGVDGAISALTTAVPGVCVELWNLVRAGDHRAALDLHRRLGVLWNALPHDNLPACVKYAQHRQGLGLYPPRAPMMPVDAARKAAIDAALRNLPI
ncbi:MAG: dihydrodipicolinate synthase family protein [Rhodospirillales bacterium]|nr:dihydrodipicolinate synthase family protein [Rhodospirillales bacterium]